MRFFMLTFINANTFKIHANDKMDWSLDGEYQEGCQDIVIENLHHAVDVIINKNK